MRELNFLQEKSMCTPYTRRMVTFRRGTVGVPLTEERSYEALDLPPASVCFTRNDGRGMSYGFLGGRGMSYGFLGNSADMIVCSSIARPLQTGQSVSADEKHWKSIAY